MCDYSMHAVANRPAKVGETLITTTFRGTSTRGFASEQEPAVAVCLLPGTELAFTPQIAPALPLSPVHLRAIRAPGAADISLSWMRRSPRTAPSSRSGVSSSSSFIRTEASSVRSDSINGSSVT